MNALACLLGPYNVLSSIMSFDSDIFRSKQVAQKEQNYLLLDRNSQQCQISINLIIYVQPLVASKRK